ncbi:TPR end-of-group domain-containing protein [Kordia sp.]|uniref:TPR end-of-group domain-containing protein n=1 Tax=Kordia sp. TaxID=1965332 RepID=UPI003B5C5EF8
MKLLKLILISLLIGSTTYTNAQESHQDTQTYEQRINNATRLYQKGNYTEAALEYEKAFKQKEGNFQDYYNTACLWSLAGNITKSLKYLNISVDKGLNMVEHLKNDTDLSKLHGTAEWKMILKRVQQNLKEYQKYYSDDGELKREVIAKDKLANWVNDFGLQRLIEEAESNSAVAQRRLARYYTFVDKNDKKKVKWLKEAADSFDYTALNNLAFAYNQGTGVETDKKEAAIYYTKGACVAPYGKTNCFWAMRDFFGLEVASNLKMETMISLVNNNMTALILDDYTLGNLLYNLASYYEDGSASDYPKDVSKAKDYYRKSAKYGNGYAKKKLAELE